MNEHTFDNFYDHKDDGLSEPDELDNCKPIDSPFTIVVDSNEQLPYTFSDIKGDFRDDYAPIRVRTIKKAVRAGNKRVGDYALLEVPGIAIERKSKADLFSSVSDTAKRENFIERLRVMSANLKCGAVIIECYQSEIFNDPPPFTKLSPTAVYRSTLSWGIQFPLIHWHWAEDRESAEQLAYRLLEKYYQHETDVKYKHHNKPIDANLEAMKQGIIARMTVNEMVIPYCEGNPLRLSWLKGWEFYSTNWLGGQRGVLSESGKTLSPSKKPKKTKSKPNLEVAHVPLPGQTSFLDDSPTQVLEKLNNRMGELFEESLAKHPVKRTYKRKNF